MKFKELIEDLFQSKIQDLKKGVSCYPMGTIFYTIHPNRKEEYWPLKKKYKPAPDKFGLVTEVQEGLKEKPELIELAEKKLRDNQFYGRNYKNDEASLKVHISLNNISELDESVVLGLIKLLIDESESKNNMHFYFKIVSPENLTFDPRFIDNDQFTVYFDKYSSTADMIRLAEKVKQYLHKQGIPDNERVMGSKESFCLNSFVSARFDANKLLEEYDVYPFFDLEIQKFLKSHPLVNDLEHIPLAAFEAVFYTLITSAEIEYLRSDTSKALSDEDSIKIQKEFAKIFNDPISYMNTFKSKPDATVPIDIREGYLKIKELISQLNRLTFDFSDCRSEENITSLLKKNEEQIHDITTQSAADLSTLDSHIVTEFWAMVGNKKAELNKAAEAQRKTLITPGPKSVTLVQLTKQVHQPQLNKKAVDHFESLLKKIDTKGNKLANETKGTTVKQLHTKLGKYFTNYKLGMISFDDFKRKCTRQIDAVKPQLAIHRGWKEVFMNLLAAIISFGIMPYRIYQNTHGKECFFKVNTDSINIVNDVCDSLDALPEKTLSPTCS